MIRAIIFDCFGVLYVDRREVYFSRFPEHRDALHDVNSQADHGFLSREEYLRAVSEIIGEPETTIEQEVLQEHVINQPLIDYIRSELAPNYSIGLVSNIGRGWIQNFFDEHQLHDLFNAVILSSEEGITKPDPRIYEKATLKLGVLPEECVMIDDSEDNCEGALKAGMKAIKFDSNDQLKEALKNELQEEKT